MRSIEGQGHEVEGYRSLNGSLKALALLGATAIVLACAVAGYFELFTVFRDYDDEGWLMVSNLLFLEGYRPYSEIPSLYGPLWLGFVKVVNGLLQVPVTHSGERWVTLALWLSFAATAALLLASLRASRGWIVAGFVLCFLFPHAIVNEPGHPQSLVTILVLALPLCAALCATPRPRWMLIGAVAMAVFAIKYNAGAFCLAAASVTLAARAKPGLWRTLLVIVLALVSLLAPFALMWPLLKDPNCFALASLVGLSCAAVAVRALARGQGSGMFWQLVPAFLTGIAVAAAATALLASALGAPLGDLVAGLFDYAGRQVDVYYYFRPLATWQVGLAGLGAALSIASLCVRDSAWRRHIVMVGRIGLVAGAGSALYLVRADHPEAMLALASPWCWALTVDHNGEDAGEARLLLAAIATWLPLIVYPMPGSQILFGSLPALVAALCCAAELTREPLAPRWRGRSLSRTVPTVVLLVSLSALAVRVYDASSRYARFVPLDLAGTGALRLEAGETARYRELVEAVRGADVVFTSFRLNSLQLWRGDTPRPEFFSTWALSNNSPEEKLRIKAGLLAASAPFVVLRQQDLEHPKREIVDWIEERFEVVRDVGPYKILRRRPEPPGEQQAVGMTRPGIGPSPGDATHGGGLR